MFSVQIFTIWETQHLRCVLLQGRGRRLTHLVCLRNEPMTKNSNAGPDLFVVGDLTGSGFDVGPFLDLELSEKSFDDASVHESGAFLDGLDNLEDTTVSFAGSAVEGLHVFKSGGYYTALDRAWQLLEPATEFRMPWETGIWKDIFENQTRSSHLASPVLCRPAVTPFPSLEPVQCRPAKSRRLTANVASWQEFHEAKLDVALKRWFDVVIMFPVSFTLVTQLAELPALGEQMAMMLDVLESRSPLTLLKGVNSITRYMTFLRSRSITAPGVESDLYAFFNGQRLEGAPQSRLASVIESTGSWNCESLVRGCTVY